MNTSAEAADPTRACHIWRPDPGDIEHYRSKLGLADSRAALIALAEAVAADPWWAGKPEAALVLRPGPAPAMAILGMFNGETQRLMALQASATTLACRHLRYVNYARAEEDCRLLADRLVRLYGRDRIGRLRFTAIPRGGREVLKILAAVLRLRRDQLQRGHPGEFPLVVVDDCALTGEKFRQWMGSHPGSAVIFAPLYSHPDLRRAIEEREERVVACLSPRDLRDLGSEEVGDDYSSVQGKWLSRLKPPRYWVGLVEPLGFPWGEPDRLIWSAERERAESAWHVVPPSYCFKNRPAPGLRSLPVGIQEEGRGPLKAAPGVLFGELRGTTVIGHQQAGESLGLSGSAAAMWRAIHECGNLSGALQSLKEQYDVEEGTLRRDLEAFAEDLLARGVLQVTGGSAAPSTGSGLPGP